MTGKATVLVLPGLGNSGPEHWQSQWERGHADFVRVHQDEWDRPDVSDWLVGLRRVLGSTVGNVVLVAHSSACALVAHWVASAPPGELARVRGALLVGPSDPAGPRYPGGPTGFGPVPQVPMPFRTIVVASTDDEYVTLARAREYAGAWRSELVVLPGAGHINVASGFGPWPEGLVLLESLRG